MQQLHALLKARHLSGVLLSPLHLSPHPPNPGPLLPGSVSSRKRTKILNEHLRSREFSQQILPQRYSAGQVLFWRLGTKGEQNQLLALRELLLQGQRQAISK